MAEEWVITPSLKREAELKRRVEYLESILRKVKYLRQRQKQFFKDKTKDNLVGAKQAEASVDRALAEWEKKDG